MKYGLYNIALGSGAELRVLNQGSWFELWYNLKIYGIYFILSKMKSYISSKQLVAQNPNIFYTFNSRSWHPKTFGLI